MSLKSETRTIDGLEVTTTQLPAMRAYTLMARLGKVVGPALAQLGTANLGGLVGAAFQNLEPADVPSLAREILASTAVELDGKLVTFDRTEMLDLVFSGRLPTMLKVLRFALETNYAGFFDGGAMNLGDLTAPAPSPMNG